MELIPHKSFSKINRSTTCKVQVTEKLDGTNGVIHVSEDKQRFRFGSRNRWLSEKEDHYGFFKFCSNNLEYIEQLEPGYHYGELVGPGVNKRTYGLKDKKFYLFDTKKWKMKLGPNISTVPLLEEFNFVNAPIFLDAFFGKFAVASTLDPHTMMEGIMIYFIDFDKRIKHIYDK